MKPERTLANVITALAGYLFASRWHTRWESLTALLVGSGLIIASACVLNNIIDRDLDRQMTRTKKRVLVTGALPARTAVIYAIALGVVGFWALAQTNWLTLAIGAAAYVSYVVIYDLAKRRSVYGTVVGAVPGAASLVAGYTSVTDRLDTAALLLFLIMAAWQMAHFYAIAIYRLKDYRQAGVPVWPVRHGIKSTKQQIFLFVAAFLAANALLAIYGYVRYSFLALMMVLGGYWYWRALQGMTRKIDDEAWARSMFGLSLIVLLAFSTLLTVGPILR